MCLDRLDNQAGRAHVALTESSFESRNMLETAQTPNTIVLAYFAGGRVHAVLGGYLLLEGLS